MKQKYVEWSKATWWVLGFAAQSPPFRMEAPPSSSLGSVDGRRTAAVLLCGNFLCLGAVLPQFHSFWHSPNLMIGQWESDRANLPCLDSRQLWKTIPAPERLWDQLRPLVQMNHILTSHPAQSSFLQCSTKVDPKSTPQWTSARKPHSLFPGELNVWY